MKKTWISVKVGIIDPKHQDQIGPAVWLFLYLMDKANWEDGKVYGYTDEQAAEDLGMKKRTIRDHRTKLVSYGYITCDKHVRDQTITIHNWTNPREYSGDTVNPLDVGVSSERHSGQSDTGMSQQSDGQSDIQSDTPMADVKDSPINNQQSTEEDESSSEKYKRRIRSALVRGGERHQNGRPDYSDFFASAVPVIRKLHELWRLPMPKRRKVRKQWSEEALRVVEACDGMDVDKVLDAVFADWKREHDYNRERGKPVFYIQRPNFLIGKVRAKVGEIRQDESKYEADDFWDT